MNKNLQTIFHYHETTKHSQQRYARSLGYMDWASQPNPFREYKGAEKIVLPLALNYPTPPYSLLGTSNVPVAPLCLESLSQLLQFSMGIAAWKESGGSSWAVRCNASSGNLHPTESYIIVPKISELPHADTAIYHYASKEHALELLASFQSSFFDTLPKGSFLVGLSNIAWREVWKYGERAFRYVNLDAGHAWQSFVISAQMLGWKVTRLESLHDDAVDTLLGLTQSERFFEEENGDMLFVLSPETLDKNLQIDALLRELPKCFEGVANQLSPTMHEWDIIPQIIAATHTQEISKAQTAALHPKRAPSRESKEVVLNRRSVHVMQSDISKLTQEQFHTVLGSVNGSLDGDKPAAHLCIFVHRVDGYKNGLYILMRNETDKTELQTLMHNDFLWEQMPLENLYLLKEDDYTFASKAISCSQEIASDGAFSLGMLCNFTNELNHYGAHRYKEFYWECGTVGQQLYLEATSLSLSGTGIGCFLDDTMHSLLGLKNNRFQILYHFTVGRGFVDSRILTKPAYEERAE